MPTTPQTSMSSEERRSLTHGEFWIPEAEREVYREALETMNRAGIPYVVSGLYAVHTYTSIYRETKDLDLLMEPGVVVDAARALKAAGFETVLHDPHWIGKALKGAQVDLIYGMSNGMGFIDAAWYENSRPGILAATPVRVAPAEELIWHRLYIGERHRFDMADVVHLILHRGHELDWDRLLGRVGDHWRLLLSQLHFFDFVYPDHRERVPDEVRRALLDRERDALPSSDGATDGAPSGSESGSPVCRGPLLSRFSFAIDVNEWGFENERTHHVEAVRATPVVAEIRESEVWDRREVEE
jgi:hypothetical protein